jgi:DNA-binding NarL/FixJ family response regulator
MNLVAAGYANAQIARRSGRSKAAVRTHRASVCGRLQVPSRTAAVTRVFPNGPSG